MSMSEITYEQAKSAVQYGKDVIKGGYKSGSEGNAKRRNMKILVRLAKAQLKQMKDETNG